MLDEGEVMIPNFRRARALRAWAGVRPLYDPGGTGGGEAHDEHTAEEDDEGRFITRTFTTLDHSADDAAGMLSIVGGKLTTYRQMAEKIGDQVCQLLNIKRPCTTAGIQLPLPRWSREHGNRFHALTNRLQVLERSETHSGLICECELVTRPQIEAAISVSGEGVSLDDLRRDLRVGMGPCQGGFCAYRTAGILGEMQHLPAPQTVSALHDFVEERFRGNRPLLWGHQLRQALLDEMIYRRALGLTASTSETQSPQESATHG